MDRDGKIMKYLDGDMSTQEKTEFEKEISSDSILQEEVNLYTQMGKYAERRDVKNESITTLRDIHKEYAIPTTTTDRKGWKIISIFFLAIAMMGLWYFVSQHNTTDNFEPDQIFAENFSLPKASLMSKSGNTDTLILQIQSSYNNSDYSNSIDLITNYLSQQSISDAQLLFYQAMALMATENYNESIATLSNESIAMSSFQTDAHWYRGLGYLKLKQMEQSKRELLQIPPTSVYYDRATLILTALDTQY